MWMGLHWLFQKCIINITVVNGISQDVPCPVLTIETSRILLMAEEQQFLLETCLSDCVSWLCWEVVCQDRFSRKHAGQYSLLWISPLLCVNCLKSDCWNQFCCALYFWEKSHRILALLSGYCRNKLVGKCLLVPHTIITLGSGTLDGLPLTPESTHNGIDIAPGFNPILWRMLFLDPGTLYSQGIPSLWTFQPRTEWIN